MKRAGTVVAMAAAATVGLVTLSTQAYAEPLETPGCTTRLVAAEGATVNNWGPSLTIAPPFVTVGIGDPARTVNDTELNALYWVDCVT